MTEPDDDRQNDDEVTNVTHQPGREDADATIAADLSDGALADTIATTPPTADGDTVATGQPGREDADATIAADLADGALVDTIATTPPSADSKTVATVQPGREDADATIAADLSDGALADTIATTADHAPRQADSAATIATMQAGRDDDDATIIKEPATGALGATIATSHQQAVVQPADDATLATSQHQQPADDATVATSQPQQPADDATLATMTPDQAATIVTSQPSTADDATLATIPAHEAATLATSPVKARPRTPADDATLATMPATDGDAATIAATGSGQTVDPDTGAITQADPNDQPGNDDQGTGVLTQDGTGVNMLTRTNMTLPEPVQDLDRSLQLSRRSVFVDMVDVRARSEIPDLVRRKLSVQDTIGRYIINDQLAEGGMGAVLDIHDHDFHRTAAMKVMKAQFANDPVALERFLDEAQITAQLEHPNIVPIHDVGIMRDGTIYYTMKMIRGESLGDVVKRLQDQDEATVAKWTEEAILLAFLKVLDGLSYAHERGVIHRDIKPDNIMVEHHGEVLVVDWGIAKVLDRDEPMDEDAVTSIRDEEAVSATMTGSIMGTAYYMAPEQGRGDKHLICAASDVYALGATLYELLTLMRPYDKAPLRELLMKISNAAIVPIEERQPDINPDLAAIIHKSMRLKIEDRYQTCKEFADDLQRYLAGKGVAARHRSLLERAAVWIAEHKTQVIVGSVMVALLAGGIGGTAWYLASQAEREARRQGAVAKDLFARVDTAALDQLNEKDLKEQGRLLADANDAIKQARGTADLPELARIDEDISRRLQAYEAHQHALIELEKAESLRKVRLEEVQKSKARAQDALANKTPGSDATAYTKAIADLERIQNDSVDVLSGSDNTEITNLIRELKNLVADAEARTRRQDALADQQAGVDALSQATHIFTNIEALDSEIVWVQPEFIDTIQRLLQTGKAKADLAAASFKDSIQHTPVPGIDDQLAEASTLLGAIAGRQQDATTWLRRRRDSMDALENATELEQDGKLTEALTQTQVALKHLATNTKAEALRTKVQRAIAERERQKQLAEEARLHAENLAKAIVQRDQAIKRWQGLGTERSKLDDQIAALTTEDDRQPVIAAKIELRTVITDQGTAWHRSEAAAQQVLRLAKPTDQDAITSTWRTLADLHFAAWRQAQARRDDSAALLSRLQLRQYDIEHRYLPPVESPATLSFVGGRGDLTLHQLEDHGHLVPAKKAIMTITLPATDVSVAAGGYAIRYADQWLCLRVEPGQKSAPIHLPPTAPPTITLPGGPTITATWVPMTDGGLWLGTTEVTGAAYAAFLQAAAIQKEWQATAREMIRRKRSLPFIHAPRHAFTIDGKRLRIGPKFGDETVTGVNLPKPLANRPIAGISRADAEAFCAWLSLQCGRTVRLPTIDEWRRAAHGHDPLRVYPWGQTYDTSLTVGHARGSNAPEPVGTTPRDNGPFGHRDLGGNVREWVADRTGPELLSHDALVAGGSWSDAPPERHASSFAEALPANSTQPSIGFRIVVEP